MSVLLLLLSRDALLLLEKGERRKERGERREKGERRKEIEIDR